MTTPVPMHELINPILCQFTRVIDNLDHVIKVAAANSYDRDPDEFGESDCIDYLNQLIPGVTLPAACRARHLVEWKTWTDEVQANKDRGDFTEQELAVA